MYYVLKQFYIILIVFFQDEEAERIKQERLKAYSAKKATKKVVIAKSSIVLDVKPWDDETDMKQLETQVRTIVMDGLVWGACKFRNTKNYEIINFFFYFYIY